MKKRIFLSVVLIGAMAVALCACGKGKTDKGGNAAPDDSSAVSAETEAQSGPEITQILISGTGDVTLGSDESSPSEVNFYAKYDEVQDPAYFFKGVKSVLGADDMTLVNFEGTLTTSESRAEKTYAFKGDPSYVNILKEGSVEAAAFANNHCEDYGEQSYQDTIKCFEDAGIVYSSFDQVGMYEVKGKKIGMVSVSELRGYEEAAQQIANGISQLREQGADAVIVSIHGGIEHEYSVQDEMKQIGHYAVDQGADLVLCHHPHVLLGVEKYNNVYIAYSLGNFCFGGNTNPTDKDTMIFQKTFTFVDDELVLDDAVKAIPCSISSTSEVNDYQPTIKEGDSLASAIETLNGYCEPFNVVFASDGTVESANGEAAYVTDESGAASAPKRDLTAAAPTDADISATEGSGADADVSMEDGTDSDLTDTTGDETVDGESTDAYGTETDTAVDGTETDTDDTLTDGITDGTDAGLDDGTTGTDTTYDGTDTTTGTDTTYDGTDTAAGTDTTYDGTDTTTETDAATGTDTDAAAGTDGSAASTGSDDGASWRDKAANSKSLMKHRDLIKSDEKIFALQ